MTKTAALTPTQQAARFCYRWYTSDAAEPRIPERGLSALQSIVGSPISAEEISQFGRKLRQSEHFANAQAGIIQRWQNRLGLDRAPTDEEALAFILELFSDMDHAVIFDQGITANSSRYERGLISNQELQFPGKMPCWTLHLTIDGKALFLNDHMEIEVGRGDMMLFHPEANYHYGLHPAAEHWEHLWVLFQPRAHWSEWLEWQVLDDGIAYLSLPDGRDVELMEALFRQLLALGTDTSAYQSELQHNRLEEIIIRAKSYGELPERNRLDKRIQGACTYIQDNISEKFSVDDVAVACSLSPSRISHLFKEHMGVSLKSWCGNLRLQQARKKLLNSSDSISVIATQVGYDDPTQFAKYFKKNVGCSPRQFRQSFGAKITN
ncbi:MAG: arabinose operon transcriptional regulator AraC [Halioglobus sp.]